MNIKTVLFLFLFAAITFLSFGQPVVEIDNLDYVSDDFSDLQFLKDIIADKQVVCLGEEDHYFADYHQLKNRLIKFLHKEMDFDLILFEASLKNSFLINKIKLTIPEQVHLSLNRYWTTKSVFDLVKFIQQENDFRQLGIDLISFDDKHFSTYIQGILLPIDSNLYKEFSTVQKLLKKAQDDSQSGNKKNKLSIESQNHSRTILNQTLSLFKDQKEIIKERSKLSETEFKLLIIALKNCLYELDFLCTKKLGNKLKYRDLAMTKNLDYFMDELFPDKKIIVWAADLHISKNPTIEKRFEKLGFKSMIEALDNSSKNRVVSIGLKSLKEAPKDIQQLNHVISYVNLKDKKYSDLNVASEFDGIFFFKKLHHYTEFLEK